MHKSILLNQDVNCSFSAQASLAAIGLQIRRHQVFEPIEQQVQINQKVVKFRPTEKLMDGWIALLAGAQGLVEINKCLRADPGLQRAFGRDGCAEQSVVQDTLDACTAENVEQMHQALETIFRQHSRSAHHDYNDEWQLLDADTTGRPCGRKAAFASKGYFAHQRNRRGRQEGYIVATWYEEIVVERLFEGKTQLNRALPPLMEAAEQVLNLNEPRRQRTIVRVDAGGGSRDDLNWLLARGYQIQAKDYSGSRAKKLAESVSVWTPDPEDPDRQVGWVTAPPDEYCRPVQRLAVRCRKKNGHWGVGVIVSSLAPRDVLWLTGESLHKISDPQAVLLAYMHFYDQRGGGVEIEIKEDKQGLATTQRNKKRFAAQQMLIQLEALAHNTLLWVRRWLEPYCPRVAHWGLKRLVRDGLHMNGRIVLDRYARIWHIILNQADPFAKELGRGLAALLAQEQVAVTLGKI